MKHDYDDSRQVAALYASVVSDLDKPRFLESLLNAIGLSIAPIDHCSIFHFRSHTHVRHVGTASAVSLEMGIRSAERYAGGLHAYDPIQQLMGANPSGDSIQLFQLTPERIRDLRYRESLAQLQTIERLSVLTRRGESWYSLNLYRSKASGYFSPSDLARLSNVAPFLGSLAEKHTQLIAEQSTDITSKQIEDRLRGLHAALSPREIAVCKMALLGYRSEAIAETLGLRYNTILTYRKRAYAKLNISSQNELFRLCLT